MNLQTALLVVLSYVALGCCQENKPSAEVDATLNQLNMLLEGQVELLEQQQVTIASLEKRIGQLEASVGQEDFVGFSAYMVGGDHAMEHDDFIPFEGILSNHGDHYDPKESEFICPTTGLYFFSVNLYSSALRDDTEFEHSAGILVVGTVTMTSIFNRNVIDTDYITAQGTVNVITKCVKGDSVWVVNLHPDTRVYGSTSAVRSTFTGMRVVNLAHEDIESV